MPSNEPRKQHYIPQTLLARFTIEGTERAKLWEFDLLQGNWRKSSPRKSGHRRDFHCVDLPGRDPFAVETFLAEQVEGPAAPVIRAIGDTQTPPTEPSDWGKLLLFVAVLAVRVPNRRREIDGFATELTRLIGDVAGSREAALKSLPTAHPSTRAAMEAYLEGEAPHVEVARTEQVRFMLSLSGEISAWLARRQWSLLVAEPGAPDFVISDDPVQVRSTRGRPERDGFAVADTDITVPLHRRCALLGTWEGDFSSVIECEKQSVAIVNTRTAGTSGQYLWASQKEVVLIRDDGNLADEREFHTEFRRREAPQPG